VVRRFLVASAFGAFAFAASGPLQHVGVLPQTAVGDASKTVIKAALHMSTTEAWACGGGRQGNNGFGNGGFDGVPGGSSHQNVTR